MCETVAVSEVIQNNFSDLLGLLLRALIAHGYSCHFKIRVTVDVIQDCHSRQPLAHIVNLNTTLAIAWCSLVLFKYYSHISCPIFNVHLDWEVVTGMTLCRYC